MRILLFVILLTAANAEMPSTWGLRLLDQTVHDSRNILFGPAEMRLEAFTQDINSEYRLPSVRRTGANARLAVTAPRAGRFYPGFILYDAAGDERIALYVEDSLRGEAVAGRDDNRQRLFFLPEPVDFKGGERIELRALNTAGGYRIESVLLMAERPAAKQFSYEFGEVRRFRNTLTFVTNWPAACTVEWEGRTIREAAALNNHRLAVGAIEPGRTYRYRISAATREGGTASTGWKTLVAAAPPSTAGRVTRDRLPLSVEGVDYPATAGVPFPKGALGSDANLRLFDSAGGEVPLQTTTLARWEDGSVKWALLDFYSRSPAYQLEYGAGVRRPAPSGALRVDDQPGSVTVSTGPLVFRINKQRFGFIEAIRINGTLITRLPSAFYLTGPDGKVYDTLGKPDEVVVEERGPVRACVRVSGTHRAGDGTALFSYTVRFHAWAHQQYIRVQHTFGNDFGASEFMAIKSLVLRIPLSGGAQERRAVSAHRDSERPRGFIAWSDGANAVTLSVRNFWQNYPKDLIAGREGLEFHICPPLRTGEYAFAAGTTDAHRLFYYMQDGLYKFRQGMTKTHEFWLGLGAGELRPMPLMAAASPQWYAGSNALGRLALPQTAGPVADYDAAFARAFQQFLKNRERNREFGMMNWGDWWGEREINWGNSEYDAQHALLLQFARTGDWTYFRAAEEAEWHNRDVDTVHFHSDPLRLGGAWGHAVAHSGDYFPQSPVPGKGIPRGFMSADHTVIEGHLDHYFLTGDPRSLETAALTADRYNGWYTRNYDFNNCRQAGWHLIHAVAMYNASGDPFHLNAARIIVERVLERQTSDGGWRRQLVPGHCACTPRHMGNAGFMVAVLMTGLKMYYDATGDERAADSIVRAARFVVADLWMPEERAFRYTSCPRTKSGGASSYLLFEGLAFAHGRTRDPRLLEPMRAQGAALVKAIDGFGKSFTQSTRDTPRFIDYLAR